METVRPMEIAERTEIDRRLRARQLRRALAVVAWVMLVVIIAIILLLGSRPAPPDFDTYLSTFT